MNNTIIIGVSGAKSSGKTSLCEFIRAYTYLLASGRKDLSIEQDAVGKTKFITANFSVSYPSLDDVQKYSKILSFADPLKEFCIGTMGLTRSQCYGSEADKNTPTEYIWDSLPEKIRKLYSNETENGIPIPRTGNMTARHVMQVFGTDVMRKYFGDLFWVKGTFSKIKQSKRRTLKLFLISDVRFKSEINAIIEEKCGYVIRLNRVIDNKDIHPSEIELSNFDWSSLPNGRVLLINNEGKSIDYKNDAAAVFVKNILEENGKIKCQTY